MRISRFPAAGIIPILLLSFLPAPAPLAAAVAAVDLGAADVETGLRNSFRDDGGDGENDAVECGPAEDVRSARRNRGAGDGDVADRYNYFEVLDPAVKAARRVRIAAVFRDDPAFASSPVEITLHYTGAAATGPTDLADAYADHPRRWVLGGGGGWVRHAWTVTDAGFRSFQNGGSDFRFHLGSGRACLDRVEVAVVPDAAPPEEVLVGAHYYPWYDPGRWNYAECAAGSIRLELRPPQPPALGRYDSSSPAVIDRHLRWCAENGVNLLILEFIAPGGREDGVCRNSIFPHARAGDVSYTLLYDWAIRFGSEFAVTPERIAVARADFDHIARHYFSRPTWCRIAGRPVACVYVTRALSGDIDGFIGAVREACAARGHDVFIIGDEFFFPGAPDGARIARWDGIFGYDAYAGRGGYWGSNGTLDLFRRRTGEYRDAASAAGVLFVPSFAPGFNDRAIRRTCADNPVMPRRIRDGAGATSLFGEVLRTIALERADPDFPLLSITSFNEWHEDTAIEPTAGTAGATARDASPGGSDWTGGYLHDDYGTAFLEEVRDATLAFTGRVAGPAGPRAGAPVEVLEGDRVVLVRTAFSTGAFTVPRLPLRPGGTYRLRAAAEGLRTAVAGPLEVLPGRAVTGIDLVLEAGPRLVRGDVNADGAVDVSDPVAALGHIFLGSPAALPCLEAADCDGSGVLDISDGIALLAFLFTGGRPPPGPWPDCGPPPAGGASCERFPPCE